MNGLAIVTAMIAVGNPVPVAPKDQPNGAVDRNTADSFARMVDMLALNVKEHSVKESVTEKELIEGAIRGLYEEVGLTVPDAVKDEVQKAKDSYALVAILANARVRLGDNPKLAGSRSLFAAINGFRHVTDSLSTLVSPRMNVYASIDQDFGIGIEVDGVTVTRWPIYQVENAVASGRAPLGGYFGPVPKVNEVPSPATLPWRVKRVVPGSPAQKDGVKPGDRILRIDGVEVNASNANQVFSTFAFPRIAIDPQTGRPGYADRAMVFQRGEEKPFEATLKSSAYNPESAFGVIRTSEEKWDCMLDREARIGYIRIGPVETGLDSIVEEMVTDLVQHRCRGLILDLRWCPGGYIDPGVRMAGLFLKEGSVIAKMDYRDAHYGKQGDLLTPPGGGKFTDLPLVVLIGQETTGGGELIASALRDNNRCVLIGQRTVGRASIQNTIDAGFGGGIQLKLTVGTSFRPNGKNRQRKPDSKPTDEWGVRPEEGLEVPITLDKSIELRREADLQSLRPATSTQALPFDDPNQDPYRVTALAYLRKKLGEK
jgi:carboxyl-terminal processing protease